MLPILHQSIWRDEAFSLLLSTKPLLEIVRLTAKDASPPLYYFILHYWLIIFGDSEVIARGLSFLFHIFTVVFIFLVTKHLTKSWVAGVLISQAALFNPFLIQYAFEIRGYTMLAFVTLAAVYFSISHKRILAGLFLFLGIFTHNFGIFNAIACAVWYITFNSKNLVSRKTIEYVSLPLLAFFLWESVILLQWTKVSQGFWIPPVKTSIFLHTFQKFASGDLQYPTADFLFMLTFVVVCIAFSNFVLNKEKKEDISLLIYVSFIPIVLAYLVSAVFAPIYHERYLIASLCALILLVGVCVTELYKKNYLRTTIVAVIAIYFAVLVQSSEYIVKTATKPPINYAVHKVLLNVQDGDIIIPENVLNFLEVKYYVQRSGRNIPVYAYTPYGKIPFYIGAILFDKSERITHYPINKRIWEITPDAGYHLRKTQ